MRNDSSTSVIFENINYEVRKCQHSTLCSITNETYRMESGQETSSATQELTIPLYIYILASLFNSVIFCAGIAGNILVIIVILKVKQLRTSMNVFLLNLSVADILVLLVCQPAGLIEFFGKDRWFLGHVMCKLVPLMENCVLHVSIMTILAVTIERYHALCRPLQCYISIPSTVQSTIKTIIGIWIIGIILTLPFIIITDLEDAEFYDGTPVKVCRTKIVGNWRYGYMIFIFIIFFTLPFFIIICFYALMIKQLTSDKLRTLAADDKSAVTTLRSRRQVVKMLIIIILLFFTSLFPIRVVSLWLIFTPPEEVSKLGLEGFLNMILWARTLMYINSAGNPVIYSLTSTKFKLAFKRVLRRTVNYFQTRHIAVRSTNQRNEHEPEMSLKLEQVLPRQWKTDQIRQERPCLSIRLILVPQADCTLSERDDTVPTEGARQGSRNKIVNKNVIKLSYRMHVEQ